MSALAPAMQRPACCWYRAPKRALRTPSVPRPGMPPYKVGGAQPAIQERRQRRVADMQTLYMMAAMARGRLPPSLLSNKVMRTWNQAVGSRPVLMHRCHKSAAASLKRGGSRSSSVACHWSKPAAVRAALCRAVRPGRWTQDVVPIGALNDLRPHWFWQILFIMYNIYICILVYNHR